MTKKKDAVLECKKELHHQVITDYTKVYKNLNGGLA